MSIQIEKASPLNDMLSRLERTNARLPCSAGLPTSPLPQLIRHVAKMLQEQINEDLRDTDLTYNNFHVLLMLYSAPDCDGGINPSVLSECSGETRTNMTRIIDDLVSRGLVERVHCKEDRRRIDLHLTAAGIKLVEHALPIIRRHAQTTFDIFEPQERAEFERLLIKLLSTSPSLAPA